jgi:hypothetical protein
MRRLIPLLLATSLLAPAAPRPKLVLAIVVDQFRYDYLLRFRGDYHAGLSRLLNQGAVFTDAHYIHAATVTAAGHSTFLSGATPSVSGIIANEWYDRESAATVTSVADRETKIVGGIPGAAGASPRRLLVSTVGDELKMREGASSKVFSISLKDRSAILLAGHMADGAFWFDTDSSHWVTSSFYMETLPAWAKQINDSHPSRRYIGARWLPFGASEESALPFCTMVAGTEVRFCDGLEKTPWGNEMIEEAAEQVISAERLGQHSGTDLLALSFSSNDYIGHAVGPDDPSIRDISIRTDRLLGKLFDAAEQAAGPGNTLVVLTADHGVAPLPELNQERHMPGGRIPEALLVRTIKEALAKKYGPGEWLMPGPVSMPYLNLKLIREHNLDRAAVERTVADIASAFPHIARAYTRTQLLAGAVQQDSIARAISVGYYGPRSGDLIVLQEPYYLFDTTGTSHGTPYDYDNHVPVIFMGAGIRPGAYRERIAVNDIAPTLAEILGLERPTAAAGQVLREILSNAGL